MKVRWSAVEGVCREVSSVAGAGTACWVEDADGNTLAGTRDDGDSPARHPVQVSGEDVALACVIGADADRWAQFFASTLARELGYQNTVGDMADATARLWKHTNALMRMAACSQLSDEPARIVNDVLGILHRSTRLEAGAGLIRLPDQESYTVFREDGIDTVEPLMLAPLYAVNDDVRLVTDDEAVDGLKHACAKILDTDQPVAVARLSTEHEHFGFLVAPVLDADEVTSEDLKMLASAAKIISVAIENGVTLMKERESTRLHVENELLSQQTKDMEEMVHVVAHDLRSPMTALYGFLHVSLDELKDLRDRLGDQGFAAIGPYADSVAEPLRDGIRSVEKLNRMVQRLLEYSRAARGAYAFERVDLTKLASGVTRSLGYHIKKNEISVEIADLEPITGDRVQLEAVFGNLVDNAIKYMTTDGDRKIEIGVKPGSEPTYFVRDTGLGMTEDETTKAFLPFQRFNRDAAPGDGIGLPHVRKIIERHGGKIWCESEKGVGSTFFFTLGEAVAPGRIAEARDVTTRKAAQPPAPAADPASQA